MHSVIGAWTSDARTVLRKTVPHLKPIVEARLAKMEELGDGWTEKPVRVAIRRSFAHGFTVVPAIERHGTMDH